ncbi:MULTISPECIES: amidohydrolase family protein [Actinoalloteichus]|uniref:Amidohydrolase n=1 Tax=Actinoalloteichus fjordicus TaxID=1612552 RepID=A0AAC9PS36_9PSEU|nr:MULTISPECIES: amidohydrolase family protein [Actinoalloteichus]APU14436.1 Amidohydrolase [Actinoalloteichus fjordicus]APU20405.1 Amidohydrolase [Actinoalloteichus sp. GBA129-24]
MTTESVVDAHHHLWDPARRAYPWMAGEAFAPIRRRYGLGELTGVLATTAVEATVLVQTVGDRAETVEFLAQAAHSEGLIAGVVGWLDLTAASVADDIAELRARPGGAALVGIRHQVEDETDPDWLARADVRRGLRAVADAGLAYDLLVRPDQLDAAGDVVRAVPDLRFVLDHGGKPPIRESGKPPFKERGKPPISASGNPPAEDGGVPADERHAEPPVAADPAQAARHRGAVVPDIAAAGSRSGVDAASNVDGVGTSDLSAGGMVEWDGWAQSSGAAQWSAALGELAEAENVMCKLSGLITEASWSDWTIEDIRPYADRLLSTFGPQRLIYGSDWPVCELAGTYGEVLTLAGRLTDALSDVERRRVLAANARDWYRLRA